MSADFWSATLYLCTMELESTENIDLTATILQGGLALDNDMDTIMTRMGRITLLHVQSYISTLRAIREVDRILPIVRQENNTATVYLVVDDSCLLMEIHVLEGVLKQCNSDNE